MKAPKAPAPPPKLAYAPKRSFSQWVGDLPDDPIFLFGFIVSLLSGKHSILYQPKVGSQIYLHGCVVMLAITLFKANTDHMEAFSTVTWNIYTIFSTAL